MSVSETDPVGFADIHFFSEQKQSFFCVCVLLDGFTSSTDTICVWRQQGNDPLNISK